MDRCLIENATQGASPLEGENEEADQADYAPGTDGGNLPALSSADRNGKKLKLLIRPKDLHRAFPP